MYVYLCFCLCVRIRSLQTPFNGAAVCGDVGFSRPNKKQQNSNANGFIVAGAEFPEHFREFGQCSGHTKTTTTIRALVFCCTEQSFLGWLLLLALLANINTHTHTNTYKNILC